MYVCVLGVWPEGSDGTDINALIRSHNRKVIALADDFCKVHLFAYPCSTAKVRHIYQTSIVLVFSCTVTSTQMVAPSNVHRKLYIDYVV